MVPVVEGLPLKVEMMNVIPCATFEQAATFERLFGDGKLKARRLKNAQKNPLVFGTPSRRHDIAVCSMTWGCWSDVDWKYSGETAREAISERSVWQPKGSRNATTLALETLFDGQA
jgi:hypothetical protein